MIAKTLAQKDKFILDATAGFRMMWFDKRQPNTLYIDRRIEVEPDLIVDNSNLDLPDNHFSLIVWDPPQIVDKPGTFQHGNNRMKQYFGYLQPDSFANELKATFNELWRVLAPKGTLVFKWSTTYRSTDEILKLFPVKPLFGQVTANTNKELKAKTRACTRTVWFCFMKLPKEALDS